MTTETTSAAAPATGNSPSTEVAPVTATTSSVPADATQTAASAEPAAVVPADAPTAAEAPTDAQKAPEKYDFKAVEGQVDPAVLSKFEGIARELNLTQAQAAAMLNQLAPEVSNAQKAKQDAMVNQWAEAAKTDKEFGGDKFAENIAIAKKALDTFGSPELTKMLNDTGLGNHPEVIRAFLRAGQKISSGSFVPSGQGNTSQNASAASKLYPTMK